MMLLLLYNMCSAKGVTKPNSTSVPDWLQLSKKYAKAKSNHIEIQGSDHQGIVTSIDNMLISRKHKVGGSGILDEVTCTEFTHSLTHRFVNRIIAI